MRLFLPVLMVAGLSAVSAGAAAAQTVRGAVLQEDSGAPIQGAMVVLVDDDGVAVASTLSNEAGRFLLRAREPGRFRLRVQRIGFRDAESPVLSLDAGATVEREIIAAPAAIVLEGITAQARRRCVVRPADGLAVATLWEEARKALAAAALTDESRLYRFNVLHYTRRLDLGNRVLEQNNRHRTGHGGASPLVSMPAEHLLSRGFIEEDDSVTLFYAPDANVLLSEAFLDAYCMRLAEQEVDGLIGLTFEPAERRGPPAVRGTLWLDRSTLELRHLEYRYTRYPMPEGPSDRVGGRVEFEPLPNGGWIVRRFWIRMPVAERQAMPWRAAGQRTRLVMVGFIEDGGEVMEIAGAGGAPVRGAELASVTGVVFDSVAAVPLAGAVVELIGTEYTTTAGEDGRYGLAELPVGEYSLTFSHPRTALYDLEPPEIPLRVGSAAALVRDLFVPATAGRQGLFAQCPARPGPPVPGEGGILTGRVVDEFTGVPLPGAVVTLTWRRTLQEDVDSTTSEPVSRTVEAMDGSFVACWVPDGSTLIATASHVGRTGTATRLDALGAAGHAELELALQVTGPQPVALHLQDWESGRAIRDAVVLLPELGLRGVSDRSGRVTFDAVRPGTHELRIEHIAYGTHVRDVDVGAEPASFEVRVPAAAIALDGIEVTVRSALEAVRRTRGVRVNVMTRTDIARLELTAEHVGHLAMRFPGLKFTETFHGEGGVRSGVCIENLRGASMGTADPCVLVVVDDIPVREPAILMSLSPSAIESIEYINALEAGPRYGTLSTAGVLLVYTRGNGPYRSSR